MEHLIRYVYLTRSGPMPWLLVNMSLTHVACFFLLPQVVWKSRLQFEGTPHEDPMSSFTFLRMSERLFQPDNWRNFVIFVRHMREGRTFAPWEDRQRHSHAQLQATGPLSRVAAELMLQ